MTVRLFAPVLALLILVAACGSAGDGTAGGVDGLGAALVDRAIDDGVPGVSVAVVDADGSITTAVGGLADAASGTPVTADTLFHAGSTHKALNAFFVATLVDDGTLGWDDPVVDVLDDGVVGGDVTLAHLLTMTGGIAADAEDDIDWGSVGDGAIDAVAYDAIAGSDPLGAGGVVFEYSNLSASLAGYAAASAAAPGADDAHTAYLDTFGERVLRPLDMGDTWLLASEARATGRLSRSHELVDGAPVVLDSEDLDADVLLPSGGLKTTAADLGRFLVAMLDGGGGVISPDAVERIWTPGLGDYAMGWERSTVDGVEVWSHEGSFDGFLSVIAVVPEAGVGVVVLANTEDAAVGVIGAAPGELARATSGG